MDAREPVSLDETPDYYGAFPRLSDAQIEVLYEHGEPRRTRPRRPRSSSSTTRRQ